MDYKEEVDIDYKQKVEYNINILIKKYKNLKERFKVNAYKKALEQLPESIYTVDNIKNVGGKKTYEKLKYIIDNNDDLEEVKDYINDESYLILEQFQKIHGIGPTKAKELYNKYNMRSIEDLKTNLDLLNDKQQIGLKYYEDILERIPYNEMIKHDKFIDKTMIDLYKVCNILKEDIQYSVVGSYRRKSKDSGDIDILLSGNENYLTNFINILIEKNYIIKDSILAKGEVKFMGMCRLAKHKKNRRIDILYTPLKEYPFAQLYFTGNYQFNIRMRTHASKLGYSLNEQSLIEISTKQPVIYEFKVEKDIFKFLNFEYLEPEERLV